MKDAVLNKNVNAGGTSATGTSTKRGSGRLLNGILLTYCILHRPNFPGAPLCISFCLVPLSDIESSVISPSQVE